MCEVRRIVYTHCLVRKKVHSFLADFWIKRNIELKLSHSLANLDTGRQEEFFLLVLDFKFIFFSHLFLKNGFVVFLDLIILFKWFLAFSSNSFEALHLLNILFFSYLFLLGGQNMVFLSFAILLLSVSTLCGFSFFVIS